jgi:hypothetical protein
MKVPAQANTEQSRQGDAAQPRRQGGQTAPAAAQLRLQKIANDSLHVRQLQAYLQMARTSARAMQLNTNRRPEAAASQESTIQRKVGFEFETHWDIEKPIGVAWNTDSKLAQGNGWQLSPDELKGRKAKIEFKTKPFETDGEDAEALAKDITEGFTDLKNYGDKLVALDAKKPLPDAQAGFAGIEVTPGGDSLAAKPQVTGGVRTDLLFDFLNDTTLEKKDTKKAELMPDEGRKKPMRETLDYTKTKLDADSKASKEYWSTVSLLAFYIRRAYQRHEAVMVEVHAFAKDYRERMKVAEPEERRRMSDAYVQAKLDKMKELAPSYAKGLASVLPRVRFAKLPGISSDTLLTDVMAATGMDEWKKGAQAWPTGLKVQGADWRTTDETIEQWIKGIQDEDATEALDDTHEFWGEREIEAGDVGHGDEKGAGMLVELRGIEGGLTYNNYFSFAKPYIDYFRALNNRAKATKA